jgi:ketosteroid isomerase-like protein
MEGSDMHPNEEVARREAEVLEAGDMDALAAMYADEFVLHYPGRSPVAGDYRGFQEFLAKVRGLIGTNGTITRELHDALGSDDHAVQLLTVTANARGRSHAWQGVVVMHTRDRKITEAWVHIGDQYGLDEFLNSLADA